MLIRECLKEHTDSFKASQEMSLIHKEKLLKTSDVFTRFYIDVALATSDDEQGNQLSRNYSEKDIDLDTLEEMFKDCKDFQMRYGELYESAGWDDGHAGYDFWLTRNRHGAGFWDRNTSTLYSTQLFQRGGEEAIREVGKQLTKYAHSYGLYSLYLGDAKYRKSGIIFGFRG